MSITILGTSHIAQQSILEVERAVNEEKPDIVALELDRDRYHALLSKKKGISVSMIRYVGLSGFIFALIGQFAQKTLGKYVNVSPGAEMKAAIKLAKKNKIKLAFIDQHIQITLKRFSKSITWKERWNFVVDLVTALFKREHEFQFDLRKVPEKELIKKLMAKVKERYPNIYNVLISERNYVMAKNLTALAEQNPDKKILAIIKMLLNLLK